MQKYYLDIWQRLILLTYDELFHINNKNPQKVRKWANVIICNLYNI